MLQQLCVRDQINGRPGAEALVLQWQEGVPLTPRTLISERVRMEWERREVGREVKDRAAAAEFAAQLPVMEMMRRANPYRTSEAPPLVPPAPSSRPPLLEAITALALDGFTRNAFFLIVDGRQVTDLDAVIPLRPTSNVTFVRLMPLKGG
jgi:hypothetical protein